jgi:hypothetical protein
LAYDVAVTRVAFVFFLVSAVCTIYGMIYGNIPDVLGGIAFALLANFLKWDDPNAKT